MGKKDREQESLTRSARGIEGAYAIHGAYKYIARPIAQLVICSCLVIGVFFVAVIMFFASMENFDKALEAWR